MVRDAGKATQAGLYTRRLHEDAAVFFRLFFIDILGRKGMRMQYWLMKSEPDEVSIDDALAAPDRSVPWTGVRNYQARNYMRDAMQIGDGVLFYHSGCKQPGIVGIAEVASTAYPDPTQFDPASPYHDPKATPETPRWQLVDVRALRKTRLLTLAELRADAALANLMILQRGSRLSITPVAMADWLTILRLLG
jgi:predicted RNA-binding protein with PUA-like domain